jgi:hypothetical protein
MWTLKEIKKKEYLGIFMCLERCLVQHASIKAENISMVFYIRLRFSQWWL